MDHPPSSFFPNTATAARAPAVTRRRAPQCRAQPQSSAGYVSFETLAPQGMKRRAAASASYRGDRTLEQQAAALLGLLGDAVDVAVEGVALVAQQFSSGVARLLEPQPVKWQRPQPAEETVDWRPAVVAATALDALCSKPSAVAQAADAPQQQSYMRCGRRGWRKITYGGLK
jgi:hypothetical protein